MAVSKLEMYQAILDKGGYDQIPDDKKVVVDKLIEKGALKMGTGGGTPPPNVETTMPSGGGSGSIGFGGPPVTGAWSQDVDNYYDKVKQDYEDEGMVGFGGPFNGSLVAGAIGSGAGGLVGGPVGAAAGYALMDQLYDKYMYGDEITPSGTAKDLAIGAAAEFVPKYAYSKAAKFVNDREIPQYLMQKALKLTPGMTPEYRKKVADAMLKYGINVSRGGLNKGQGIVQKYNKIVSDEIERLSKEGTTIDMAKVLKDARKRMYSEFDQALPDDQKAAAVDELIKQSEESWAKVFGYNGLPGGTPLPKNPKAADLVGDYKRAVQPRTPNEAIEVNPINIAEAQSRKQAQQKMVADHLAKTQRVDSGGSSIAKVDRDAALATDLRNNIAAAAPETEAANQEMNSLLSAMGEARNSLASTKLGPAIPMSVIAPAIVETGLKGGFGAATGIGTTRWLSSMPPLQSSFGNALYGLSNGGAQSFINSPNLMGALLAKMFTEGAMSDEQKSKLLKQMMNAKGTTTEEAWNRKGSVK